MLETITVIGSEIIKIIFAIALSPIVFIGGLFILMIAMVLACATVMIPFAIAINIYEKFKAKKDKYILRKRKGE